MRFARLICQVPAVRARVLARKTHCPVLPFLAPELGRDFRDLESGSVASYEQQPATEDDDPVPTAWVQERANRVVGDLLGDAAVRRRLEAVWPTSDDEFAAELVDRELGLIADGDDPVRIYLSLAVLRTAREMVAVCAQIRKLPETQPTRSARTDHGAEANLDVGVAGKGWAVGSDRDECAASGGDEILG